MLGSLLAFLLARLREKSTWTGIAALIAALGFPAVGLFVGKIGVVVMTILGAGLITMPTKPIATLVSAEK